MKLSKLIKQLQELESKHGDLDVVTNSEYGVSETQVLVSESISYCQTWESLFDEPIAGIDANKEFIHIGGY